MEWRNNFTHLSYFGPFVIIPNKNSSFVFCVSIEKIAIRIPQENDLEKGVMDQNNCYLL